MQLIEGCGPRRAAGRGGTLPRACVTGVRRSQYIEFDFIMGDPDLSVELVMPMNAFRDFCRERQCEVVATDAASIQALVALGGAPLLSFPSDIRARQEIAR